MPASTLLVTVRGPLKTLDLELPGDVPVGELLPLLLEICGSQEYDPKKMLQAHISLQVEGDRRAALSPARTLNDADIGDGAELVLQINHSPTAPVASLAPRNLRYKGML